MELEDRLEKLRGGVTLVKPEDRKVVEQMCGEKISQWRKRKRMFKDLWDTITENSPKDLKEFKVCFFLPFSKVFCKKRSFESKVVLMRFSLNSQEELGLEYDEDVGVSLQSLCDLLQRGNKRPR